MKKEKKCGGSSPPVALPPGKGDEIAVEAGRQQAWNADAPSFVPRMTSGDDWLDGWQGEGEAMDDLRRIVGAPVGQKRCGGSSPPVALPPGKGDEIAVESRPDSVQQSVTENSQGSLTAQQKRRIEDKREEALQKRIRRLNAGKAAASNNQGDDEAELQGSLTAQQKRRIEDQIEEALQKRRKRLDAEEAAEAREPESPSEPFTEADVRIGPSSATTVPPSPGECALGGLQSDLVPAAGQVKRRKTGKQPEANLIARWGMGSPVGQQTQPQASLMPKASHDHPPGSSQAVGSRTKFDGSRTGGEEDGAVYEEANVSRVPAMPSSPTPSLPPAVGGGSVQQPASDVSRDARGPKHDPFAESIDDDPLDDFDDQGNNGGSGSSKDDAKSLNHSSYAKKHAIAKEKLKEVKKKADAEWQEHIKRSTRIRQLSTFPEILNEASPSQEGPERFEVHESHRPMAIRSVVFCKQCGYWATKKSQKLRLPCSLKPLHSDGAHKLRRMMKGLHPDAKLSKWPEGHDARVPSTPVFLNWNSQFG